MRHRSSRPNRLYFTAPNAIVRDESLPSDVRFLIVLMMSYADEWEFHVAHLQKVCGWGRDKLRNALRIAEESGHLVREMLRGETGLMEGSRWIIIDDPQEPSAMAMRKDRRPPVVADLLGEEAPEPAIAGENEGDNRPPENQGIGDDNRPPEYPAVGSAGPIRKNKDKKPLYPLSEEEGGSAPSHRRSESAEGSGSRRRRSASSDSASPAEPGPVDEEAIARQQAAWVIEGKGFLCAHIRAETARKMLALGLVSKEQLRAVNLGF